LPLLLRLSTVQLPKWKRTSKNTKHSIQAFHQNEQNDDDDDDVDDDDMHAE